MDRDFIEKIYVKYYSMTKCLVKNSIHTSNSDDITSCVQDVFIIAMGKEGLENHANIKAWLFITAKNVVKTFNRKRAIRNKYHTDFYTVEPVMRDFATLLDEKIDSERFNSLNIDQIIMESLSKNERKFYFLLRFKNLRIAEISKLLSISEAAAATRQSRLKEKIKNILKKL